MAAAVLFPPRYALGDDDDAPASSSRFRARLNPWRPAPLFIPDADEEDPAERTNASGSCTDELQSVEREIAGYAAARAQVARELALAREQVHQFSRAAAAPGGADAGVTPESTRACGATPHRVEAGAEAGTRAERSDGRARAAGGLRGASRSERERLLDAELQACFGVPPPETPMSSRGVLSARPGSARLDLNFDDGCDDGEGVEGGVGGGWWHGTCASRRPSFFPDGGYDSGQDEDQHGVGEAPEVRGRCPHRERSLCKQCGGVGICEHQRRGRSQCKECGGASICQHQHRRSTRKDAGERACASASARGAHARSVGARASASTSAGGEDARSAGGKASTRTSAGGAHARGEGDSLHKEDERHKVRGGGGEKRMCDRAGPAKDARR